MGSFEQFRLELRDALPHLHDPDYRPPASLCAAICRDPTAEAGPVQSAILEAVRSLAPSLDLPADSRARRDYDVLHQRFVLRLTQEQTAERLHMSDRSLRRAQREATHTLARLLWERRLGQELLAAGPDREQGAAPEQPIDWQSQVRQDLSSLQMSAPASVADVREAVDYAVTLERGPLARYGTSLAVAEPQPGLVATVHPSVLRQILIMAIAQMARCVSSACITIQALLEGRHVAITLTGPASRQGPLPDASLIGEILALQHGSAQVRSEGGQISFHVRVPAAGEVSVLVVDDNPDQLHFYRRCAARTRYHIVHAAEGQRTVAAIQSVAPDVIVLDILLPDADGWDLLAQLQRNPATRSIPVIICSIIREEELASASGATLYLPKPVQHRQFIQALDRALAQAPAGSQKNPTSSAAVC